MIKKISFLKDYGVYKDFSWSSDSDLSEFKERNIIYGWNYSGKTTLSRIFECLGCKKHNDDYKKGKFKIELYDSNDAVTESDFSNQIFEVQVFNCDYVSKNLNWDEENGVDPIQFDVGGGVKLRKELEEIQEKIERGQKLSSEVEQKTSTISNFENTYTKESKRIKLDVFNSLIEFSKGHMKRVATSIENDIKSHVLEESEYKKHHKASLEKNDKTKLPNSTEDTIEKLNIISDLYERVGNVLREEPLVSSSIDTLEQSKNAHLWAQSGLKIHNEEDSSDCLFCGQPLPENRLEDLKSYFSNEASKLKDKIKILREEVEARTDVFSRFDLPKSKNDLVGKCQARFEEYLTELQSCQKDFEKNLPELLKELDKKEDSLFNSVDIKEIDLSFEANTKDILHKIKDLITEHNSFVDDFESTQESSRDLIKKHLVAKYLLDEDYSNKKKVESRARKNLSIIKKILSDLECREREIEGELKNVVAGKNELNNFIKLVLNRDDIAIEVTGDDRFVLKRGTTLAKNLSEGEKTAISFSYFLVMLESLHREGKLVDTIVFIDDPISSLDSNHIAHIYSLINSFFFRKGVDPDDLEKFVNCFKQLFISTHNFEFFSFLKDSNRLNKKTKSNPRKRCEYFFIKRIDRTSSVITALPKSLKMKSEYLHLFESIYKFYQSGCDFSKGDYILMPNAIRRFLELYTLIKLPGTQEEIDGRLNKLLGGVHQLKVLHHFSHFTSVEKVTRHDELIANLKPAVDELMELLKLDENHYNSLVEAVSA